MMPCRVVGTGAVKGRVFCPETQVRGPEGILAGHDRTYDGRRSGRFCPRITVHGLSEDGLPHRNRLGHLCPSPRSQQALLEGKQIS